MSYYWANTECTWSIFGTWCTTDDFDYVYTRDPASDLLGGWTGPGKLGRCLRDPYEDAVPLQRMYVFGKTDHYFSADPTEVARALTVGRATMENSRVCYVYNYQRAGTCPVYRIASPFYSSHIMTQSRSERDDFYRRQYQRDVDNPESIAFYTFPASGTACPP